MKCPICGQESRFEKVGSRAGGGISYDMLRCGSCGSDFADPLKEVSNAWYEGRYQFRNYPWRWEFGLTVRDLPGLLPRDRASKFSMMDVGCGDGKLLREVRRLYPESDLMAVDFNRWATAGLPPLSIGVFNGKLDELASTRPEPRDVIAFYHLFEHLDDPNGFLRSVAGLLRPGGRIVMSIPNRERWNLKFFDFEVKDSPPHHLLRFSRRGLESILSRNGFVIEKLVPEPFRFRDLWSLLGWRLADSMSFGLAAKVMGKESASAGNKESSRATAPAVPKADSPRQRLLKLAAGIKQRVVAPVLSLPYAVWFAIANRDKLKGAQGHALYVIARRA